MSLPMKRPLCRCLIFGLANLLRMYGLVTPRSFVFDIGTLIGYVGMAWLMVELISRKKSPGKRELKIVQIVELLLFFMFVAIGFLKPLPWYT